MSLLVDIEYGTKIVALTCGECHIPFGIPAAMHTKVQNNGSSFHCPNGHRISYSETEIQRLKNQVDNLTSTKTRLMAQRDDAQAEARHQAQRANGYKGAMVKVKKRVAKGVCPCCNRHFANVKRHMDSQHPEFADE